MSEPIFGAPSGLLSRLSRTPITADDVRTAVEALAAEPPAEVPAAVVSLQLGDGPARGPLLLVAEAGRLTRVPLADLAGQLTRARVPATSEGIAGALASWLLRRPVPDAIAAETGTAVLHWTGAEHSAVGWQVVVVRDGVAVPWRPSATASLDLVHRIRSAAFGRASVAPARLRLAGPIAVWTHPEVPGLDTAVLVRPEDMLAVLAEEGLPLRDMHVVVTPGRPVACGDPSAARRLAAEGTEPCVLLPWRALTDLRWG